jgi:hypothetical protein
MIAAAENSHAAYMAKVIKSNTYFPVLAIASKLSDLVDVENGNAAHVSPALTACHVV